MNDLAWIGLGGALGAICRYLTVQAVGVSNSAGFPLGTFTVNVVGCFCVALAVVWLGSKVEFADAWRLMAVNGFLGAFTTFSAFSLEAYYLMESGQSGLALLYVIATLLACIAATSGAFYILK